MGCRSDIAGAFGLVAVLTVIQVRVLRTEWDF
jgi:hypothetical protein